MFPHKPLNMNVHKSIIHQSPECQTHPDGQQLVTTNTESSIPVYYQ